MWISCGLLFASSHITQQPKTARLLKLSRVEPGQYLDERPPAKTRLLLEEVLVSPVGGAHPVVCVGPNAKNCRGVTPASWSNFPIGL